MDTYTDWPDVQQFSISGVRADTGTKKAELSGAGYPKVPKDFCVEDHSRLNG
jgi:hypothetical protein